MKTSLVVIKFGGEIVENDEQLGNLVTAIGDLHRDGVKVVLIHGGGPMATKLSQRMGLTPKMIGGRRVTCAETLQVMKMVLPGIANSDILAKFRAHRLPAASVSGITTVKAVKRPPKAVSGSEGQVVDFGFVGDIVEIDPTVIEALLAKNLIPVVGPLSCDDSGQILNINADTVAVQIARTLKASEFVLITEIGGVYQNLKDPDSRLKKLTIAEAKEKIQSKVIEGGMIPKLEESFVLLEEGLKAFHIVGIKSPNDLVDEIRDPGSRGTAVIKL
jgi:acetylglutamate kinase